MDGNHLEQSPHLAGRSQPVNSAFDLVRTLGIGTGQGLSARFDAEADQPLALTNDLRDRCAFVAGCMLDSLEVDVSRQILLARAIQHGQEAMCAHGLQRLAGRTPLVPIVDEESHSAVFGRPLGDCADDLFASR
jgi:hypothetical protein